MVHVISVVTRWREEKKYANVNEFSQSQQTQWGDPIFQAGEPRHMSDTLANKSTHTIRELITSFTMTNVWANLAQGGRWLRPLQCHASNIKGSVTIQSHQPLHSSPFPPSHSCRDCLHSFLRSLSVMVATAIRSDLVMGEGD